jgi:hypothetical protein
MVVRKTALSGYAPFLGAVKNRIRAAQVKATLPPPQSDLAEQVLKDPYIFDFLTLAEPFRERELELALLDQVQNTAEYALKGVKKAIGVSAYQLTRALPKKFQSSLPTVEQMETELARFAAPKPKKRGEK